MWIPDHKTTGHVVEPIALRSYHVSIPTGVVRRNRAHLRSSDRDTVTETAKPSNSANPQSRDLNNSITVTKSGRVSKPPKRWINEST